MYGRFWKDLMDTMSVEIDASSLDETIVIAAASVQSNINTRLTSAETAIISANNIASASILSFSLSFIVLFLHTIKSFFLIIQTYSQIPYHIHCLYNLSLLI